MGSMRHFLDENWHLFSIKKGDIECLIACLDKYCNECRNGSFHLNNINPKSKIDFIRNNTFFLYVVLLTTIKLGETQFETDEAFKVIKSTKVERLYNLIITGVSNQFEFIYSDGNKLLNPIDVVYDVYNSDVPSFNEFGQIKSAKLKFNHVNDNLFSLVTERIYPNEIWYRDNKGNKIEVI